MLGVGPSPVYPQPPACGVVSVMVLWLLQRTGVRPHASLEAPVPGAPTRHLSFEVAWVLAAGPPLLLIKGNMSSLT